MRRLKAVVRAGLREVPCTIQLADDDRSFLLNTIQNLHRRQLPGAERVRAIEKLAATDLGVGEISRRAGFHKSTVSRWLRIDRRPLLKEALEAERIDVGRATVLADAPEELLSEILPIASQVPQAELWRRVAASKALHNATLAPSVRTCHLSEALRLLDLAERVAGNLQDIDLELVDQLAASLDRLRARHYAT